MASHPSQPILAVAGEDKSLCLFSLDHKANAPLVPPLHFKDATLRSVCFARAGEELLLGARKPHFYAYHLQTGQLTQFRGGGAQVGGGEATTQHMFLSPGGGMLAMRGSSGYVHLGDTHTKHMHSAVKCEGPAAAGTFLSDKLLAVATQDKIFLYDVRYTSAHAPSKCVSMFSHEGGGISTLSAYTPPADDREGTFRLSSPYLAVGTSSGVLTVYEAGLSAGAGVVSISGPELGWGAGLRKAKDFFNLTTSVSAAAFHPSGQMLAAASCEKKDQLRMFHLPSLSTFTTFPLPQTPLHRVSCVHFAPGGEFVCIGNYRGRVLVYELPHFLEHSDRKALRQRKSMN
eukprot:gene40099-48866_t